MTMRDADDPYNVLFLCTGNSARSIIGEGLVDQLGGGRFKGYSAGSMPKGEVHPRALNLLGHLGIDTSGFRSKSWDEFAAPDAPKMDFIFTVCDNAAGEVCPAWPGQPMSGHWGIPDPAAVNGSDAEEAAAFAEAARQLGARIRLFLALPLQSIDRTSLRNRIDEIGRTADGAG